MLQSCIEIGTFEVLQLIKHSNTKIKQTHNIEEYIVSNLLIKSQKKKKMKKTITSIREQDHTVSDEFKTEIFLIIWETFIK